MIVRERARGIGHLRRMRIDIGLCSEEDISEVERASNNRYENRGNRTARPPGPRGETN